MNEVACVFRPVVEEVRARGIAPERLLDGLPIALDDLGNPRRRISWDDFAELARRCCELFGPDVFEELAARSAESAVPRPLRWLLLGWWCDVRRAYRIGPLWGPRVFRATRAECEVLPDGRLRQVIEILPPYRESPEFFHGVKGLLRATPRLFGEPDARVEVVSDGRRGEFLIEPAPAPARDSLRARVAELRGAGWGRGAGTAERFARAVARARSWREIPAVAARSVRHELGVRGVALSLREPPHHADAIVAAVGERSGRPASVRRLVFTGRTVGSLVLWTPGGRTLDEQAERRLHALRLQLAFLMETLHVDDTNRRLLQLLETNLSDWKRVEASLERIAAGDGAADPLLTSTIPPFEGTVLLIEDDELLRRRSQRDIEAEGHAVLGVASDLANLPPGEPASGPIRLVVADLDKVAGLAEALDRIVRLHRDLRGVLLVRLRPR